MQTGNGVDDGVKVGGVYQVEGDEAVACVRAKSAHSTDLVAIAPGMLG